MKTTIDHLPDDQQQKLQAITAVFTDPTLTIPIDMLILFGSRARGDWVDDQETGYKSDYDLLVVVENEKQVNDLTVWGDLERKVRAIIGDTPLTFIVHDIKFVNKEIRVGQYFFGDIANEGVMLFDRRRFSLAKPKALNAQERLALAERNFENWYDSAGKFWRGSRDYGARQWLKESAFLLHQATERYYHAAILVFTGYKQRTHDIELLGVQAGEQHALLVDLLPKTEPDDKHLFDLLKKAYIDARYSMSYRITADELAELQKRVLLLADRVRAACLEKIATFCGADAMRKDLPEPPTLSEPVLQNLPPPPTDPQEFGKWAQSLSELAEQRAELRWQEGKEEGRAEGFQAGEEKGIQIGEERGREQGRVEGEARALLLVLRSRGIDIPVEVEKRITECTDPVVLASWLSRAATVSEVAELLAG
ncbi:MAG TPA: HEPN domain-containing protein [Pseudomonadota bacterium]|nr:HEPN domain-containing protein [Pseudomonadota bacterium]